MFQYLMTFVLLTWTPAQNDVHRMHEMAEITRDIMTTDATVDEALKMENTVAFESGFERGRVGRMGELGAFQIMPWPGTPLAERNEWLRRGAKEALRRMRTQGMQGYCGCVRPCPKTIEHRTWPARLYRMAFDPPAEVVRPSIIAANES